MDVNMALTSAYRGGSTTVTADGKVHGKPLPDARVAQATLDWWETWRASAFGVEVH